jgi:hypothetical protein
VVLPINASVSANALSALSAAEAGSSQGVLLDQVISGDAIAHGNQTSAIDQTGDGGTSGAEPSVASLGAPADHAGTTGDAVPTTTAGDQPAAHTTPPNAVDGQPASDSGQPTAATTQPTAATTQPAADTSQPATAATQPAAVDTQPAAGADQPAVNVGDQPALDTTSLDNGLLNVDVNVDLNSKLARR